MKVDNEKKVQDLGRRLKERNILYNMKKKELDSLIKISKNEYGLNNIKKIKRRREEINEKIKNLQKKFDKYYDDLKERLNETD